jgi:Polypeptide deformylase
MILKVAKLGVKTLRQVSRDVDPKALSRGDYEAFLSDLEDTMREYDGTGIAAPQVFTQLRVFLYEVHPETRKRKEPEVPLTALFNATYEGVGEEMEGTPRAAFRCPFSGAASCRDSRRSASRPSTAPERRSRSRLRGITPACSSTRSTTSTGWSISTACRT